MSPLELVAVAVSALGLWLLARRNVWSWPVSLIGVALYGWIFLRARLYSDVLLQIFYAASAVYGWFTWRGRTQADGHVAVATPSLRETALSVGAGALGAAALGDVMAHTNAAAPWLDSALACFSLVAQVWTARRFIQSWWLWIALDLVYIGLYAFKGLYATSGLYGVFTVICIYGLADWRRAAARGGLDPVAA